jgi:hypothetical protein
MSKNNKLTVIGIIVAILGIVIPIFISQTRHASNKAQETHGHKSPLVITDSGNVSINYDQDKDNDSILIQDVVANFYNDYLKYLNQEFSALDDESGFSQPTPRNPDGTIDLSNIQSAPAYGLGKQTLAKYLYSRNEIAHSFAQKIDEMILEAMQDDEGPGGLEFDPILMAQDTPTSLEYSKPVVNGQQGTVTVHTVWGTDQNASKGSIKVSLYKTGKSWRIVDISDLN